MADRLLVIADHYGMAMEYAKEHGLGHPGESWRYIYAPWQTNGLPWGGVYVVLSTGELPSDALKAASALERKGYKELEK